MKKKIIAMVMSLTLILSGGVVPAEYFSLNAGAQIVEYDACAYKNSNTSWKIRYDTSINTVKSLIYSYDGYNFDNFIIPYELQYMDSNGVKICYVKKLDVIDKSESAYASYISYITSLKIADGIEEIGANAFKNFTGVKQIEIPASVTKIDDSYVNNTTIKFTVANGNKNYKSENGRLIKIESADTSSSTTDSSSKTDSSSSTTDSSSKTDSSSSITDSSSKTDSSSSTTDSSSKTDSSSSTTDSHKHNYVVTVTEPTCRKVGTKEYKCSCGSSYTEEIPMLEHDFDQWEVSIKATCTQEGLKLHRCKLCKELFSAAIPKIDHSYTDWKVTVNPTCTENGEQIKTCTVGNEIIRSAIPAKGHTFDKWSVTKESTCGDTGLETRLCKECGMVETKVIPKKTSHNFGAFTKIKDPTCSSKGERSRVCLDCGLVQTEDIPTVEHEYGDWEMVIKPSCESEGKLVKYCINCNNSLEKKVPKIDHEYGEWNILRKASCSQEGLRVRYCKTCLNEDKKIIEKTEHDFGEWKITRNPNCEREGEKKRECVICNDDEIRTIPKTDHQYGEYTITKPVTCTSDGEEKRICKVCDNAETRIIRSTGHDLKLSKTVKPTTEKIGYTLYQCSKCSKTEKDNFLPKLVKITTSCVYGLNRSYSYKGRTITPKFTVIVNGKTLRSDKDYSVEYKNNVNIGKATIVITGKGSYAGRISKTFDICPTKENITGLSAVKNSLLVKFKSQNNVSGYQINVCSKPNFKGGRYTTVNNRNITSAIIKNLSPLKKYYIRVRSFKIVNKVKYYGEWSTIKGIYTSK